MSDEIKYVVMTEDELNIIKEELLNSTGASRRDSLEIIFSLKPLKPVLWGHATKSNWCWYEENDENTIPLIPYIKR